MCLDRGGAVLGTVVCQPDFVVAVEAERYAFLSGCEGGGEGEGGAGCEDEEEGGEGVHL